MAEFTVELVYNLQSGKIDILVDYHSDADALPIEHEDRHKDIVHSLLEQGLLNAQQLGEVKVQRAQSKPQPPTQSGQEPEELSESN